MNTKTILAAAAMALGSLSAFAQSKVSITELDVTKAIQDYGKVTIGKSVTGETASVNGSTFSQVLGVHSNSVLKNRLDRDATRFSAKVGVADTHIDTRDKQLVTMTMTDGTKIYYTGGDEKQFRGVGNSKGRVAKGKVQFLIKGDGKTLYDSGIVSAGKDASTVDISLEGVNILELVVTDGVDGPSGDAALWIEPTIAYKSKKPSAINADAFGDGPQMTAKVAKNLQAKIDALPVYDRLNSYCTPFDWLVTPQKSKAGIYATPDRRSIVIANNMVARKLQIFPNLATTDYINCMTGESMLRAVSEEGRITIDGEEHLIGGLAGQPERAYIKEEWLSQLTTIPGSFIVEDFEVVPLKSDITWKRTRWALCKQEATGTEVIFTLRGERSLHDVVVKLHMAVYDQQPIIKKRFEIINNSGFDINVDSFKLEYLAMAEPESPSGGDPDTFMLPNIHVESDFNCKGSFTERETDITEHWVTDPAYTSQRNYAMVTPCILDVSFATGPDQNVATGTTFRSFAVYEMPYDSYDRERKGLFNRKMQRAVAPWTTQNPIFLHLTSTKPEVVRRAVDQCAECGYEMIILSFGSGADAENISEENIARIKELVDYAHSRGIEMGCYALLASRWISDEVDVINPATGKRGGAIFGSSPCLSSDWGEEYFKKIKTFFERTGMNCFEHDGSYPGDVCASTKHSHHKGLNDSQWNQFYKITELYHWMCANGIYLNVPDYYFLNGSTKVSIGYRETNWSLPRDRQLIHTRQLNYDCTWERIPSSLWSFVPLVEYHGGGKAATLEPLSEHLYEYRTLMYQNYGAGVQACYRGPRLYDTEEVKQTVIEVIDWYKRYREILNSDIIHLRKPDARDWDGIMHVNPELREKALAMFFNPTDSDITRTIEVPLHYAGLTESVNVRREEGAAKRYSLSADQKVTLEVTIPAKGFTWYVFQ